ncbi:MAG TPA: hypothetical protein VK463_00470 [Desulfomonilaceae bacterium]|nr:hypothetical protein [Desulfomonilaceae bacterium]
MISTPETSAGLRETADVYLFYGEEFLVKEQVDRLVARMLPEALRSTNLLMFDGGNLDLSALSTSLFTPSLFGGPRVLLVEQTTLFTGRVDHRKILDKTLESWKGGDRRAALAALGQLLSAAGVAVADLGVSTDWINDIGGPLERDDAEILAEIAQAFLEEGKSVSRGDEGLIDELIQSVFPEGTALIFTALAADKRKKLFKAVEKRGQAVECAIRLERYGPSLDRSFFDQRVRQIMQAAGKNISASALEKMYARTGTDMRRLQSEIDKLIGYAADRPAITDNDVESVFSDFHQAAFFELNNVLRTRDITRCLPALHENLKIVAHPLQTLGAIATEFRRLMVARELLFTIFKPVWKPGMQYNSFVSILKRVREENPALTGKGKFKLLAMKDYPLFLYVRDAQKFSLETLLLIMEKILHVDVMLKSSKIGNKTPQLLLEDLVFTICDRSSQKTSL